MLKARGMVFSSIHSCFYFFPCFFLCYFLLPWKNLTLTIFSLVFCAWGKPHFVPLPAAYLVANYGCGLVIGAAAGSQRRWAIGVGVALNIGMLFWFKYLNFLTAELGGVVARLGSFAGADACAAAARHLVLHVPRDLLLVDVYKRRRAAERNVPRFTLYMLLFPQLIAGPIVR